MASCSYCGSTIIFGGVSEGGNRFCNDKCYHNGYVVRVAGEIPENEIRQLTAEIHNGQCPECDGRGPIDVHKSHRVWSALLMTSWSSDPLVCCRSCGLKKQAGSLLFSSLLGWWGFPWGLIMTPVQIFRNLAGMTRTPDPYRPSAELEQAVRLSLASTVVAQQQAQAQPSA